MNSWFQKEMSFAALLTKVLWYNVILATYHGINKAIPCAPLIQLQERKQGEKLIPFLTTGKTQGGPAPYWEKARIFSQV